MATFNQSTSILKIPNFSKKMDANGKLLMNRDYKQGSFKAIRNIGRWFPIECQVEMERLALKTSADNNTKAELLTNLLKKYNVEFSRLGGGTNRFGILIEEYAVKIALDSDGLIDNFIETLTSRWTYPDSIGVYELSGSGVIEVTEYGNICDIGDFKRLEPEIRAILERLSDKCLIGDVGINVDNYVNWIIRNDGKPAMMDFAYIYPLEYIRLKCDCHNEMNFLNYDENYDKLICSKCQKKWTFGQMRQRIPRTVLLEMIGHIVNDMYCVHNDTEEVPINPNISPFRVKRNKHSDEIREKINTAEYDNLDNLIHDIINY